jgi:drug/metabolite transporter (DMT)-like permease
MSRSAAPARAAVAIPLGFVLLWSTGFIVPHFGLPHAPPIGLLLLRFLLTLLVLAPLILWLKARWPTGRQMLYLAVVGVLLHGVYLSGVWFAISVGLPSAISALIVNLQPILTAILVSLAGQSVTRRQWLGLFAGFTGVVLVMAERFVLEGLSLPGVLACVAALAGITAGTLYQKRHVPSFDLRTGSFVQYLSAAVVVAPIALLVEQGSYQVTLELALALAWASLALSIGAVFLLFILIERGEATRVTALLYLVPPVTALMAWLLFDEAYGPLAGLGMVCAGLGVALVQRRG